MKKKGVRPIWDLPITVDVIQELTFNQIKARSIAAARRGIK